MALFGGDIRPTASGIASLGVDGGPNPGSFDLSTLAPWITVHQLSGIFHDPLFGQSGVIRFNQPLACFEVSVDGGLTFSCLATTGGTVTSVGVLGDVDLTGDVDFASPGSGFIIIEDSADASPLLWSVDRFGLSGLWGFPSQGFPNEIPRCHVESFTSQTSVTVNHNIGTDDLIVQAWRSDDTCLFPDDIQIDDVDNVTVSFNRPQSGRIVVIGCI